MSVNKSVGWSRKHFANSNGSLRTSDNITAGPNFVGIFFLNQISNNTSPGRHDNKQQFVVSKRSACSLEYFLQKTFTNWRSLYVTSIDSQQRTPESAMWFWDKVVTIQKEMSAGNRDSSRKSVNLVSAHIFETIELQQRDADKSSHLMSQDVMQKCHSLAQNFKTLFKNCTICISGFSMYSQSIPDSIEFLVRMLGGIYDSELNEKCTHLIIGITGTPKHLAAHSLNSHLSPDVCKIPGSNFIHIVTLDWIVESFRFGIKQNEDQFSVPPFWGHRISITGFKEEERNQMIDLITKNGGVYEAIFSIHSTHLVAASPNGEKYKFALSTQVPVVNKLWLQSKISHSGCVNDLDEKFSLTCGLTESIVADLIKYSNQISFPESDELSNNDMFFADSMITLYGFGPELDLHLRKLVLQGFGTRLSVSEGAPIHPNTTHIIVPVDQISGKSLVKISSTGSSKYLQRDDVPVVNARWLLESCKRRNKLPPDNYLVQM